MKLGLLSLKNIAVLVVVNKFAQAGKNFLAPVFDKKNFKFTIDLTVYDS